MKVNVIFVHHSCFVVELEEKVLVFDYFNGDRVDRYRFTGKLPVYEEDTPIYFFASHKHQDHFDMDIYRLAERYTDVHYVISKDAKLSPNFMKKHGIDPSIREKITYVGPESNYKIDDMEIHTIRSTDAGVAFLVKTEGKTIYHAGDLHDWWMDGAGDIINGKMQRTYQSRVRSLADEYIDLAFVVIDPRMGRNKFRGIEYFIKETRTKYIFPMHTWQQPELIEEFKGHYLKGNLASEVVSVSKENQEFEIEI